MDEQKQRPTPASPAKPARKRYVPAVGPRLKKLLVLVLVLFSLLAVNSLYMSSVTLVDWLRGGGSTLKGFWYVSNFLIHLVLGLLITIPVIVFGIIHIRNAYTRPNRRAVKAGIALFATALVLIVTGYLLTRIEGVIQIKDGGTRSVIYWVHVISPLVAAWLFVLHRLAGKKIKWRVGLSLGGVGLGFAAIMLIAHSQDPTEWNVTGPESGAQYFFPSLARTDTGNFIPADVLMMDHYCQECHGDIHENWAHSMHRFSSFNNPAYLFSVKETRRAIKKRDGTVQGSRFCAGCHDPVPFFSGAFDDDKFDDPEYDLENDELAQAGITCTVCHAITNINSVRGNSDYTIAEPVHYPFSRSENGFLRWVNRQLVKAKPELHKKTFLKPLHKTPEFCGTCHKVHLPVELNKYKWLRGQNHYDSYLLSGVSGHGVTSFYYPDKAFTDCSTNCHMPFMESDDFGAKDFRGTGTLEVHDHQFPSANTGIPHLLKMPEWVNEKHREFNVGRLRVDIFGIKEGGEIEDELVAPLRPTIPALEPGKTYLLETVIRTLKLGHLFTQGTADSNEVWLELTMKAGDRVIGRMGGRGAHGRVDPWSHFVNAYVLDREGKRIDRRNAEDIFVALYNNQIPPGAADVVHSRFTVPGDVTEPITVEARLNYRKFDTTYLQYIYGSEYVNDLPIMLLAEDTITFPVRGTSPEVQTSPAVQSPEVQSTVPEWQRWNDYGIGLYRKRSSGELRQAEAAFAEVGRLGRPDGPLNRARVYIKEGRLEDAVTALRLASERGAPPWTVAWFTGVVNKQNGNLQAARESFTAIVENAFEGVRERDFDFSRDYRVLNALGQTIYDLSKRERRDPARQRELQDAAIESFRAALVQDPENLTAHYNLHQIYRQQKDDRAEKHYAEYERYKLDDNARGKAVQIHRRANPAANHAAEAIVIYDLQRTGAYGLSDGEEESGR